MSEQPDNGESFRLIYRSRDLIPTDERKVEHGKLFSQARSRNKGRQICGALVIWQDSFVQALEGDEDAVRALYTRIEADPRHDQVAILHTDTVSDRVFQRWHMARVGDDGDSDMPLIAHQDGISPAAGRGTTPAQEEVLTVMRAAARQAAGGS